METKDFESSRTGKPEIVPGTIFPCFSPKKLPFGDIEYGSLIDLISNASRSLGKLSEAGLKVRNPNLLITPYLRKEAVLSSRIEGTRATLSDVFINELEDPSRYEGDVEEVLNYVKAVSYGLRKIREGEKISTELIKEMHKILLEGVRGEFKDPGQYKEHVNWIGPSYDVMEASFVPCHPDLVEELMENLIEYLNNGDENPIIKIALAHYQFEAIHPFRDGNGRLGRLLIILYLCQEELISQPLFYISAFFEKNREDYESKLKKVSTKGEVEEWLKFFLTALDAQAKASVSRIEKMDELYVKYRDLLLQESHSTTVQKVLDLLFENPFITIPKAQKKLGIGYSSAKYNVEILEKLGIVEEIKRKKKGRLFIAKEISDVLNI